MYSGPVFPVDVQFATSHLNYSGINIIPCHLCFFLCTNRAAEDICVRTMAGVLHHLQHVSPSVIRVKFRSKSSRALHSVYYHGMTPMLTIHSVDQSVAVVTKAQSRGMHLQLNCNVKYKHRTQGFLTNFSGFLEKFLAFILSKNVKGSSSSAAFL
uniref:Phospholipase SGR2-like isoform X5 n=1 Tax=Rhizophora mucronata TaxID=61149 RepID=A0A2P2MMR6_RHIMU